MSIDTMPTKIHQGNNVKRFREMQGIKQDALAAELGDDWSQKKVSRLEEKEIIEPEILEQVAKALKVPVEAIREFDSERVISIISNTFNTHDQSAGINLYPTFNPVEKWIEAMEENKKLYERMLQMEKEKSEMLHSLLKEKKS